MSNVTIAVDTAKNVFEIAISSAAGRIFGAPAHDAPPVRALLEHA